jgi:hypothetical protein
MITICKKIGSKSLLAVCILSLCLAAPAHYTAAAPANLPLLSGVIDPPEIPFPPPPPCRRVMAMERTA